MKRRDFIKIAGGGVIVTAGIGGVGFIMTRTPTKALLPWREVGWYYSEPRRRALSYALLAPNPHNRQPWLVDLSNDGEIKLFVDTARLLPATDPFSRQITIGLGCFLELLRMAGAEQGYRAEIDPFPEGYDDNTLDSRPVAVVRFDLDASIEPDPLFSHVLDRRSLKEPYDMNKQVPDQVLADLQRVVDTGVAVDATNQQDELIKLRRLTHDAMDIEIRTPHTYKESVDLFRIGKTEVDANPDGIDFSGAFFETLAMVGQFDRDTVLDYNSSAFKQGYESIMANCDTAMGFIWLTTATNTRLDQLNVGRDWVRINLAATALGVGTQPMSQALQEYPEMEALYTRVHALLVPEGGTVQMLARLGYGPEAPPSPRWRLEEKVIKV